MTGFKKNTLELNRRFERKTGRHFLNETQSVFHCHHYSTLVTQLALDADETELLANAAEESLNKILVNYFRSKKITDFEERIEIACQYYAAVGLGKLEVVYIGEFSGEIKSEQSHVDKGWLAKWGKYSKSVNYIGSGYISAMFSAIFDKPVRTFFTQEVKSIVKGDEFSLFKVYKK